MMYQPMTSAYLEANAPPQRYCRDPQVQIFCEISVWNFSRRAPQRTAHELIDAACQAFGAERCSDLSFWLH